MSQSIVLDTNIFIHYLQQNTKYFETCEWIVYKIKDQQLKLTLDHSGIIFFEYHKQIKENSQKISGKILMKLIEKYRYNISSDSIFKFVDPIDPNQVTELEKIGFHSHDLIFVQVAPKSDSKKIISTDYDSFLNEKYRKWIRENLNVLTMDPIEFING